MYILVNKNNVVMSIGSEMVEDKNEEGVVWIDGAGYGLVGQEVYQLENIPSNIVPDKYKYINGEFTLNEDYVNPNEEQELVSALGQELAQLKIQLIMGGVL